MHALLNAQAPPQKKQQKEKKEKRHISSTINPSIALSVIIIIVLRLTPFPIRAFQCLAPDAETKNPSDKRDPAKETPGQGLAFGLNPGREREEATRDEGTYSATGSGKGLGQAVECTEN